MLCFHCFCECRFVLVCELLLTHVLLSFLLSYTCCLVIRGLALGTLNEQTQSQFLSRELKMAVALSAILSTAGFARAIIFQTPFGETVAVTSALMLIVFSSICLGAVLPLFLKKIGVDPAHSSTTIQVRYVCCLCCMTNGVILKSCCSHTCFDSLCVP
jgi:hypothetical protein